MTNAELMRIEMIHSHTRENDHTAKNIVLDRSRKLANTATFIYATYITICLIAYIVVDQKFKTPEGIKKLQLWKQNYRDCCHKDIDLNVSLQNVVLYGCGYVTLTYGAYLFTIYRQRMLRYS